MNATELEELKEKMCAEMIQQCKTMTKQEIAVKSLEAFTLQAEMNGVENAILGQCQAMARVMKKLADLS